MAAKPKQSVTRAVNAFLLITIIAMLVINRERFWAMMNPKGRDLVTQQAPELAPGLWYNGEASTLESLRGKVVLIDFWAFQCRNCLNVLPLMKSWAEKYRSEGLVVIGIHTPETAEEAMESRLRQFIAANDVAFPVLADNAYANWNRYRVQFWPTTFLIDRQGYVRTYHIGELGFSGLESKIQDLLRE